MIARSKSELLSGKGGTQRLGGMSYGGAYKRPRYEDYLPHQPHELGHHPAYGRPGEYMAHQIQVVMTLSPLASFQQFKTKPEKL